MQLNKLTPKIVIEWLIARSFDRFEKAKNQGKNEQIDKCN